MAQKCCLKYMSLGGAREANFSLIAFRDKDEEFEVLQGLAEIESFLMKPPTLFLRLIIGDISVTLPHREDRSTSLSVTY